MDLTDEQKERVRAEEVFREAVREEISSKKPDTTNAFIRFVNSSFGMWLMTVVVAGFAVNLFNNLKQASEDRVLVKQIDIEIRHRLQSVMRKYRTLHTQAEVDEARALLTESGKSFYSKFKDDNVANLLYTEGRLLSGEEQEEVGKIMLKLEEVTRYPWLLPPLDSNAKDYSMRLNVWRVNNWNVLAEAFTRDAWQISRLQVTATK